MIIGQSVYISMENQRESPYPAQFGKRATKQHSDALNYEFFVHSLERRDTFVSEQMGVFNDQYCVDPTI